jgi:predicted O-methyltransferase YrrM
MSTETMDAVQSPQALMHMVVGFWMSQAIYSAAKLGIADQLQSGPKDIGVLAMQLNAHEGHLYRLLRALANVGIFREQENKHFEQTPMSRYLCSDTPDSMRAAILMLGDDNYRAWSYLADAVQNGGTPFELAYGTHAYEYYKQNPAKGERFNTAMAELNRQDQAAIAEVYDFNLFKTIVDVGGGSGLLLTSILKRHSDVSGILFELPQVADEAKAFLKKAGVENRCQVVTGDFFQAVVSGGDAYILSHIIHTFNDELCVQILRHVHTSMPAHGKLLVVEDILQPGNDPATAKTKFMDLNMLVFTPSGREHTREEFETLFAQAGFRLTTITPTASGIAVIEAIKA